MIYNVSASWKIQATHNKHQHRTIDPTAMLFMLAAQLHSTSPSLQRILTDLRPFNEGACHSRSDAKTAFPSNCGQSSLKRQCPPAQYGLVGDKSIFNPKEIAKVQKSYLYFKRYKSSRDICILMHIVLVTVTVPPNSSHNNPVPFYLALQVHGGPYCPHLKSSGNIRGVRSGSQF